MITDKALLQLFLAGWSSAWLGNRYYPHRERLNTGAQYPWIDDRLRLAILKYGKNKAGKGAR